MSNDELKQIRKELGWTNSQIAAACGVSVYAVDHYMRSRDWANVPEPTIRLMRLIKILKDIGPQGETIAEMAGIKI